MASNDVTNHEHEEDGENTNEQVDLTTTETPEDTRMYPAERILKVCKKIVQNNEEYYVTDDGD